MTIFKAYDVRGLYLKELTEYDAMRIGQAFGSYAKGRIALGRDTRHSGPSLQKAFLEGVLSTGCSVDQYDVIPITILSFITWTNKLNAAAYISASHNPPEYNGIRFRTNEGYGLLYHKTEIIKFHKEGNFCSGTGDLTECKTEEAVDKYAEYISSKLILKNKLKIVLDMGNGSASVMTPFFKDLGFEPMAINDEKDGDFPGRGPAPSEKSLQYACEKVIENKADFGVGFDPDADRGVMIDDKGRVIPPEKIAIILAKHRYHNSKKLVIASVDCSMILEKELEKYGMKVKRERVGDVYIANTVKDTRAVLGVERAGHFFLPEFQYSDDPFSMSVAVGEILSEGLKLSELADQIPDYPYLQKGIPIDKNPSDVMKLLQDALASEEPDKIDGLKIMTESYSVLIRPSNTEPLLRLSVETTTQDDLKYLVEKYENIIRKSIRA